MQRTATDCRRSGSADERDDGVYVRALLRGPADSAGLQWREDAELRCQGQPEDGGWEIYSYDAMDYFRRTTGGSLGNRRYFPAGGLLESVETGGVLKERYFRADLHRCPRIFLAVRG